MQDELNSRKEEVMNLCSYIKCVTDLRKCSISFNMTVAPSVSWGVLIFPFFYCRNPSVCPRPVPVWEWALYWSEEAVQWSK